MTPLVNRLDDRALLIADAIQVENAWMFDYVAKLNRGRQIDIRMAPPGVDTNVFLPAKRAAHTDAYILCVGRLNDPRKNVELLLEAYSRTGPEVRSNVRLVLAGRGEPPAGFWTRAEELGVRNRIRFLPNPNRDELVALYQQAAMFVLPSDEEGLGVVVLEAMACGAPVVSTRCGGPEGIITDGEDGFLVDRDDPESLGARLRLLYTDRSRRETVGLRARATVERRFSARAAGRVFVDVWETLLRAKAPST